MKKEPSAPISGYSFAHSRPRARLLAGRVTTPCVHPTSPGVPDAPLLLPAHLSQLPDPGVPRPVYREVGLRLAVVSSGRSYGLSWVSPARLPDVRALPTLNLLIPAYRMAAALRSRCLGRGAQPRGLPCAPPSGVGGGGLRSAPVESPSFLSVTLYYHIREEIASPFSHFFQKNFLLIPLTSQILRVAAGNAQLKKKRLPFGSCRESGGEANPVAPVRRILSFYTGRSVPLPTRGSAPFGDFIIADWGILVNPFRRIFFQILSPASGSPDHSANRLPNRWRAFRKGSPCNYPCPILLQRSASRTHPR